MNVRLQVHDLVEDILALLEEALDNVAVFAVIVLAVDESIQESEHQLVKALDSERIVWVCLVHDPCKQEVEPDLQVLF